MPPCRRGQKPVDLVCLSHKAICLSASTSAPVTAPGEGGRGALPPVPSSVDRPRNKSILLRANWSAEMVGRKGKCETPEMPDGQMAADFVRGARRRAGR